MKAQNKEKPQQQANMDIKQLPTQALEDYVLEHIKTIPDSATAAVIRDILEELERRDGQTV